MISCAVAAIIPMAKPSFIRAEQPLASDLTADFTGGGATSRRRDLVFVVNPRGFFLSIFSMLRIVGIYSWYVLILFIEESAVVEIWFCVNCRFLLRIQCLSAKCYAIGLKWLKLEQELMEGLARSGRNYCLSWGLAFVLIAMWVSVFIK